jgi:hypothetical protein
MKRNLTIAAVGTFLMIIIMQWQGAALKTTGAEFGIIDLEFANTAAKLHALLAIWDIGTVKMNIWLDFVFIVSYVLFLSFASAYTALKWPEKSFLRKTGLFLVRVAFVAGVFDIAENLLMLQSMGGNFTDASLHLTYYCAAIKFSLIGLILLYLVAGLPSSLRKK